MYFFSSRQCVRFRGCWRKIRKLSGGRQRRRPVENHNHLFPRGCNDLPPNVWEKPRIVPPYLDKGRGLRIRRLENSVFRDCYCAPESRTATTRAFFLKISSVVKPTDSFAHAEAIAQKTLLKRAVDRNRAKRRLRAALREVLPTYASRDRQYLAVCRAPVMLIDFRELQWDIIHALKELNCFDGAVDPGNVGIGEGSLME